MQSIPPCRGFTSFVDVIVLTRVPFMETPRIGSHSDVTFLALVVGDGFKAFDRSWIKFIWQFRSAFASGLPKPSTHT